MLAEKATARGEESMAVLGDAERLVVVGVDCSSQSAEPLLWADRQARLSSARLVAVTSWHVDLPGVELVSADDGLAGRTRQMLAEAVADALGLERSREVTLRVSGRAPAKALVEEARDADLLVVGPRSAHGIRGLLLGSVSERVLSHATCPVAVIHTSAQAGAHRIVVGLDGSPCSRRALDWAIRQAELTAATVEAIVAWEWRAEYAVYPYGRPEDEVQHAAEQLLDRELATLPAAHASIVRGSVRRGHPAEVLVDASAGADSVVVGNHGAGLAAGRMLGSISQKVARHASVPVVVVHDHDPTPSSA
jgi:nucleotide-binding universal stress UspA family protein